ncbi:LamG domain-containing protein [Shewanella insulae]|uniref:LamG domain-containing protein n=1 Tax=Shewanella insulae TaxID=2681496 RepID=UPI001EFECC40|nr:LamG domain-containing protein [Shewanella insulae]MCG9714728.1 LamG domain-containing protein [Shewanella insulae]
MKHIPLIKLASAMSLILIGFIGVTLWQHEPLDSGAGKGDPLLKVVEVNIYGHSSLMSFEEQNQEVKDTFRSVWTGTLVGGQRVPGIKGQGIDFSANDQAYVEFDICCKSDEKKRARGREITFEFGGISMAMWIKPLSINEQDIYPLLGGWYGDVQSNKLRINQGHLELLIYEPSGFSPEVAVRSRTVLSNDRWYHIALVHDGHQANVYIDGELDASDILDRKLGSIMNDFFIGGIPSGYPNFGQARFPGIIDEFVMSERIFSAKDIRAIYGLVPKGTLN